MNRLQCEHESDVSRAARSGFWPGALRQHAESCPACSETSAVTEALLAESARIGAVSRPSDTTQAWLEARRRARLHLRRRATFWFRALRVLTCIYIPAAIVWTLSRHFTPASSHWQPTLRTDFASLLTGPAEPFAVAGVLLAALCITMGSWYMLREARTPLQHSPSR
ncbi:MAG: hypothetical protein WA476_05165 [Acidobacteriaceae bacterium]